MQPNRSQHPPACSPSRLIRYSDTAQGKTMTKELIEQCRQRPAFADQAFVAATVALVVSIAVAFAAVSIGIARAAM
jgi:hypothetical protein